MQCEPKVSKRHCGEAAGKRRTRQGLVGAPWLQVTWEFRRSVSGSPTGFLGATAEDLRKSHEFASPGKVKVLETILFGPSR